jgi:hypothetical protein
MNENNYVDDDFDIISISDSGSESDINSQKNISENNTEESVVSVYNNMNECTSEESVYSDSSDDSDDDTKFGIKDIIYKAINGNVSLKENETLLSVNKTDDNISLLDVNSNESKKLELISSLQTIGKWEKIIKNYNKLKSNDIIKNHIIKKDRKKLYDVFNKKRKINTINSLNIPIQSNIKPLNSSNIKPTEKILQNDINKLNITFNGTHKLTDNDLLLNTQNTNDKTVYSIETQPFNMNLLYADLQIIIDMNENKSSIIVNELNNTNKSLHIDVNQNTFVKKFDNLIDRFSNKVVGVMDTIIPCRYDRHSNNYTPDFHTFH